MSDGKKAWADELEFEAQERHRQALERRRAEVHSRLANMTSQELEQLVTVRYTLQRYADGLSMTKADRNSMDALLDVLKEFLGEAKFEVPETTA